MTDTNTPKKMTDTTTPKKWAKPSIKPETGIALTRIAKGEGVYVYRLVDDMMRTLYPSYFRG